MISLQGVYRSYGDFVLDLSLEVNDGELVAVLGPSGSGKTTTLRVVAGFEAVDRGRVLIAGRDVGETPPSKRRLGIVFQDYTLFPHLSVGRNVAYGLARRKMPAVERGPRVEEMLELVGLPGFADRRVDTLSGGEAQRVAVARALAFRPDAFLLDEPFSAIDAPRRRELRGALVDVQRKLGITTLFVTHSRQEALSIADRVAVMRDGRIEQLGHPQELYDDPANRFVAAFVGVANFFRDAAGGLFLLRPERLRVAPEAGELRLPAVVAQREYFGHYYAYSCRPESSPPGYVPDSDRLTLFSERRLEVASRVILGFRRDDLRLLGDDGPV